MPSWKIAAAGSAFSAAYWSSVLAWTEASYFIPPVQIALGLTAGAAYTVGTRLWWRWTDRGPERRGAILWIGSALGSILGAFYWMAVVILIYGLFGGDPGPGVPPPSPGTVYVQEATIFLIALAVHIAVSRQWRRFERIG